MSAPTSTPTITGLLVGRGGPLRYAAAGLVNSGVGYAVILALSAFGVHPFAANAGGFAAGFAVSLILAERWTFGAAERRGAPARYAVAFACCYAGNLGLVAALLGQDVPAHLAQGAGVFCYAAAFYLTCRWWVYGGTAAIHADLRLARRTIQMRPGLIVLAVAAPIAVGGAVFSPTPSDVIWQMWIARQLNAGVNLYSDILEVNPPLWFWMAMPADRLGGFLSVPPQTMMKLFVGAFGLVGLALCTRLTRGINASVRLAFLTAVVVASLVLPLGHIGQREHIALIACLPYVVLAARRSDGWRVPWHLAFLAGAFAVPGLGLKHYYVLLPVLLEVWRIAKGEKIASLFRPETASLLAGACLYAAAVLALSRDFLTQMVPLVRLAYGGYDAPLPSVLFNPLFVVSIVSFSVAWSIRRQASQRADAALPFQTHFDTLSIAFVTFALAYAVQMKALPYHLVPLSGLVFILIVIAILWAGARGRMVLGALAFSVSVICATQADAVLHAHRTYPLDAARVEAGDKVFALSHVASWSLPHVDRRGAVWSSRALGLWPMEAVAEARVPDDPFAREEIVALIAAQVAEDMRCNPPDFILTDTVLERRQPYFEGIANALSRYADVRAILDAYEPVATQGMFTVHRRIRALPAPEAGRACRVIY